MTRILHDHHRLNRTIYTVENDTEMWLPVSIIKMVAVKEGTFLVTVPSDVLQCSIPFVPFGGPYARVEVHRDSHEELRRFMTHQGNPLWDVLHELRYNPQFGSQLEAVKEHFVKMQKGE